MFAASKTASVSGGYQISRSLRFNRADSAYLNRTPASATNRKTWTWSAWVKRGQITSGQTQTLFAAGSSSYTGWHFINGTDILELYDYTSGYNWQLNTTQVFRDPSAWYHMVVAFDTTQATASNRIKLYVNGTQVTSFSTASYPTQNADYQVNNNVVTYVGRTGLGSIYDFDGYQTEINFIDGQALTPSSFGETNAQTGVWGPKAYSGSFGTNGFYLNFSDNSNTTAATLGKDYSGNGNNWTPNNFSVTAGEGNDSLVDSPTAYGTDTGVGGTVRGNYCTWNPLAKGTNGAGLTMSNGNLNGLTPSNAITSVLGTIGVSSGKWYWEVTPTAAGNVAMVGIGTPTANVNGYAGGAGSQSYGYFADGDKYFNNVNTAYGASFTDNDVIGVALNMDAGTVAFYKNGTSQGTAFTGLTETILPMMGDGGTIPAVAFNGNFGQRPFAYTAPSGFKALCTQNLPTPTIGATTATQAGKFFNPILWTGNGSNPRSITGVGFQPDFSWLVRRDIGYGTFMYDAVRGATKMLASQSTNAESTYQQLNSFDTDGFTQAGAVDQGNNISGGSYVAWNWKANGSGVSNTAGSITSTVSANTTSGCSVVTWTGSSAGQTVGHGLGVAPSLIIAKTRNNAGENWPVYHKDLGVGNYLFLSSSAAANSTYPTYWGSSAPTSTIFGTFTGGYPAANNYGSMVAYCFAEVAGYSKIGSYTGNGSATGPFIYTGFRPAFVLIKNTTSTGPQWWILDNKRNVYNPEDLALPTSLALAEQTIATCLNFLSNGFQITTTNGDFNTSSSNYIFMAIAENPFKYSLAR